MNTQTRLERYALPTILASLVPVAALLLGSLLLGPANPDAQPLHHLKITEVMADNRSVLADENGAFHSWAEITNTGTLSVDLSDICLTDDAERYDRYRFPERTLKPGESLVVFLTGDNDESRPYHATFSLDSDGETIYLFNETEPLCSLTVSASEPDCSFGLDGDDTVWFATATPGAPNRGVTAPTLSELKEAVYTGITINEVSAVSSASDAHPHDWVELYNTTDAAMDLSGYRLTENPAETGILFENTTLGSGDYLLVYCDKDGTALSDVLCAPFSLDGDGDTLYLITPDNVVCDRFSTGKQRHGVTSGRDNANRNERVFFDSPTPSAANGTPFLGYAAAPILDRAGGYTDGKIAVSITVPDDCTVYYTTNGSVPTTDSRRYTVGTAVSIDDTTVLRAVAYREGYLVSDTVTQTYLTDAPHDLPVISVSADSSLLFGAKGAWTQFKNESLRPTVHTEYFSESGVKELEFDSTFRIAGGLTRYNVQKPFSLNLNQAAGDSEVTYPFFEDTSVTTFDNLLLRPSGSDWNKAKLRDEFCAQALKNTDGQLIQSAQPVVLYINGDYYGLYYLREKRNEDFIAAYTDIPASSVQIVQHPNLTTSTEKLDPDLNSLITYAKKHDLTQTEHYNYVMSQIDAESLMQFFAYQTFFGNGDCINNTACYRDSNGGKWKWIIFDMDWACTSYYANRNFLQQLKDGTPYATLQNYHYPLFTALLKNDEFCTAFLKTYARLLQTTLSAERLTDVLDSLAAEIESEIPRQYARFGAPSKNAWNRQIDYIRSFIIKRESVIIDQLQTIFKLSDEEWAVLYRDAVR